MAFSGVYELDPTHTTIGFVARHAMVTKVRGSFTEWEADVNYDDNLVKVVVKTESIDTNNADRDGHARGEEFFDVEKYPEMIFEATQINVDENGGTIDGNLTIKDVTKPITLDVEIFGTEVDPWGQTRVGFEATTDINRTDYGVNFQAPLNSGGVLVSEKIKIEIEGSAIKK